jgi:hypothetical protein
MTLAAAIEGASFLIIGLLAARFSDDIGQRLTKHPATGPGDCSLSLLVRRYRYLTIVTTFWWLCGVWISISGLFILIGAQKPLP